MTFDCERCGCQCRDNFNLTKHLNRKKPCVKKQPIKASISSIPSITIINNYTIQHDSEKSEQEHQELLERLISVLN